MKRCVISLSVILLLACAAIEPIAAQVPAGPNDWPQWRGPNRDGISNDKGLLKQWPESGPDILWQVDTAGVGYSSIVVKNDRIITQGDLEGIEHTICLNAKNGEVLWAVQPADLLLKLNDRVAQEFKSADRDGNDVIDEAEAWRKFGRNFNSYDRATEGEPTAVAKARTSRLLAILDTNKDGQLTFAEAGETLRDDFEQFDKQTPEADPAKLATARAIAILNALDKDKDGKISREESRRSEFDRPFNRADIADPETKKGDELLTRAEIEEYLSKRQSGRDGVLTATEIEGQFANSYAGKDGIVTRDELRGFYGGYRNGMGDGPRGTPIVDEDRVYVEGGNGDLSCLDIASGDTIWHLNLSSDLGGGRPGWGYSESPLIEGALIIVTPGGKDGTLAALNKMTGEVVWRSTGVVEAAHYSSPVAADIGGIREIVQFARESVFGVNAATGQLLWKYSAANNGTANCFTPIVHDDHVFVSSGYGTGTGVSKISTDGRQQLAEQVYFLKKLQSHHGGAVKIGDYIYSNGGGTLMCIHYLTGEIAWQARSVGKGSLIAADGMLYVLSERQEVALVEANPKEYVERGTIKLDKKSRPSWAHPVVCGGRLYIRDQGSLTAYNVRK